MNSNINRVSPVLKRFVPGQLFQQNPKTSKRKENEEKEEEDSKINGDWRESSTGNSAQSKNVSLGNYQSQSGIDIKNVASVQRNDVLAASNVQSQAGLSIINQPHGSNLSSTPNAQNFNISRSLEKELDKAFEKLVTKGKNDNLLRKFNFSLENVFKKNAEVINVRTLKILPKVETEKGDCDEKNKSPRGIKTDDVETNEHSSETIKFLGKKRSPKNISGSESEHSNFSSSSTTKNIFKTHRPGDNPQNEQASPNVQTAVGVNFNLNKKLSLFDRFFILFKQTCYSTYKVNASISPDKREFQISYTRKDNDNVNIKIVYDHENQKIKFFEKLINNTLEFRNSEEENASNAKTIADELKSIIDDITKNVEKK